MDHSPCTPCDGKETITTDTTNLFKASLDDAYQVALSLRYEDRRELEEGHGLQPTIALPMAAHRGCYAFKVPDGRIAGLAGNDDGQIWMLCTSAIEDYPVTFARESKRFVDRQPDKLLWNIADKRNTIHLKLLKFLGFKFLREVTYGPNNITFIEFCKCVHQPL